MIFANRISSSTSCSICLPETSPSSSSRDVLRHRFQSCNTSLSAEIAGLESLDLNQLRARWKVLYETEAPPHLSRDLLRRAVAYRIQENVLGGLKPATRRLLERVAEDARARKPSKVVPLRKVGLNTILIREWGGTRHEVTVLEGGAMFRGKRYRSLSGHLRERTGKHWAGGGFPARVIVLCLASG